MSLPFYKSSVTAANLFSSGTSNSANTGLWYTRFYNAFTPDWSVGDEGKGDWIQRTIELGGSSGSGDPKQLKHLSERQKKLCSALGGTTALLETDASFVTGMGLSHPVENGFTFHPTLGVPYLPASGIKGVLRAWVEVWMERDAATQQDIIARWFGAAKGNDKNKPEGAGNLIFFDALPTKPVKLACEVMTPHIGKWYEKGGEIHQNDYATAAPADWYAPVPVPFLVVKKGTEFEFMVAPRLVGDAGVDAQTKADVVQAMQELQNALEWMGAGSKTATGYGRMVDRRAEAAKKSKAGLVAAGIVMGDETWEKAKLSWNKGKSMLTLVRQNSGANETPKTVSETGKEAKKKFDDLSEPTRKKLEKDKPVYVKAFVNILGNTTTLLSIEELVL